MSLSFLLEILALAFLILATAGISTPRVSFGWLGMTLWLLSLMIGGVVLR